MQGRNEDLKLISIGLLKRSYFYILKI